MAEQTNTQEMRTIDSNNSNSLISRATSALDKFQKFSNEPAVQRSIPVMITLFVIFIGIILFLSFSFANSAIYKVKTLGMRATIPKNFEKAENIDEVVFAVKSNAYV